MHSLMKAMIKNCSHMQKFNYKEKKMYPTWKRKDNRVLPCPPKHSLKCSLPLCNYDLLNSKHQYMKLQFVLPYVCQNLCDFFK